MKMGKSEYMHLSIPMSLGRKLAKLVGHHGFRNPTEVVMWCIREKEMRIDLWLEEIEKLKEETAREFGHKETQNPA